MRRAGTTGLPGLLRLPSAATEAVLSGACGGGLTRQPNPKRPGPVSSLTTQHTVTARVRPAANLQGPSLQCAAAILKPIAQLLAN